MQACVCTCGCVYMSLHMCRGQRSPLGVILQKPSTLFLRQGLPLVQSLQSRVDLLASTLKNLPASISSVQTSQVHLTCRIWGLNPGPHTCISSTLPTELPASLYWSVWVERLYPCCINTSILPSCWKIFCSSERSYVEFFLAWFEYKMSPKGSWIEHWSLVMSIFWKILELVSRRA